MKQNLSPYEKIYLTAFIAISRTNKSIPEWSTTFFFSLLFFMNLVSILVFLNFDLKNNGNGKLQFGFVIIILLHWFYFLKNNRAIKKFKKVKYEIKNIEKVMTGIYCLGSLALFFFALDMGIKYYLIVSGIWILLVLSINEFGGKPIDFK